MSEVGEIEKKKQKPKSGRVVRLTPDLVALVAKEQREGEFVHSTIRRLLGVSGSICWVLPSDLHEKVEDARGEEVIRAFRGKRKPKEKPVPVRKL